MVNVVLEEVKANSVQTIKLWDADVGFHLPVV
jgi:hypothetical protein